MAAKKKTAKQKQHEIDECHRLWKGGEKGYAVAYADDHDIAPEDCPKGMAKHIAGMPADKRP